MYGFRYTSEQIDYLITTIPGHSYKEIIELFYHQFRVQLRPLQLKSFIGNRKLNTGRTGRFEKGQVSHNKGKKGIGGWEPTQFKKGNIPANYRQVGSERVNVDGYVEIKIADPNKWRLKHQVVWEEHNGQIQKGYAVIFGDRDKQNLDINNLILVSRKQLATLNQKGLIQIDADLTRTGVTIVDICHKMSEIKGRR